MRIDVLSVREAREQLPSLLDRFRQGDRRPVFLGSRRRTEAVMLPVEVYNEITEERAKSAAQALASLRVEGFVPRVDVQVVTERWIHGEITNEEMREQVRALYGVE
jgi:PHD/YefM family antitoxin component YafN of YafNO toxin-antitoxin module